MAGQLKPPFAYYGGKTTLAPRIADLLPPHQHYVEPFAGSLAVLLAKRPSAAETANDIDGDLVAFWRVLRDRPAELVRACALTPHAREELAIAADLDVPDDLERARRVFVRLTQSRSLSMKQTGWKYAPSVPPASLPKYRDGYVNRMMDVAGRLSSVSLENRDALELIRDYGTAPDVCLYLDPPYLGETRATNYREELLSADDHQTLAEALHNCEASVVLSGYDSPLYATLFAGWHRTELPGASTLAGVTGRVEVLWSNVPLGNTLFDLDETA